MPYKPRRITGGLEVRYSFDGMPLVRPHKTNGEAKEYTIDDVKKYVEINSVRGSKVFPGHNFQFITPEQKVVGEIQNLHLDGVNAVGNMVVDPLTALQMARGQWTSRSPELHSDWTMDISLLGSRNAYFEDFEQKVEMTPEEYDTLKADALAFAKADPSLSVALRASDVYGSDPALPGMMERLSKGVAELNTKMTELRALEANIMERMNMAGTEGNKNDDPALRAKVEPTEIELLREELRASKLEGVKTTLKSKFTALRSTGVGVSESIETRIINVCAKIDDAKERDETFADLTTGLPKAPIADDVALRAAGTSKSDIPADLKSSFDKTLAKLKPEGHKQALDLAKEYPALRAREGDKISLESWVLGNVNKSHWIEGVSLLQS